jgi:hypothetical protein
MTRAHAGPGYAVRHIHAFSSTAVHQHTMNMPADTADMPSDARHSRCVDPSDRGIVALVAERGVVPPDDAVRSWCRQFIPFSAMQLVKWP